MFERSTLKYFIRVLGEYLITKILDRMNPGRPFLPGIALEVQGIACLVHHPSIRVLAGWKWGDGSIGVEARVSYDL